MTILYRILLIGCFFLTSIFGFNTSVGAVSLSNTSDIFNAGINNLRQQNYPQALVDFTQVIERQDMLLGAAYSNRCLVNLQLENDVAAEADCIAAIENHPDNIEAHLNLGLAYHHQGKYQKAIAEDNKVIQLDKQDYRAYYNSGLAYSALNDYQKAIAEYQTALNYALDSGIESQSLIYNDLALVYVMLAKHERAILNFDRAIALNENNYYAYYNRGCTYHRQEKYRLAIQDFTRVIQLQPNFTQAYVHRGIVSHQMGAKDTAFNDLNWALQQYQNQGNLKQYKLVLNLKQQLFYAQPSQIV